RRNWLLPPPWFEERVRLERAEPCARRSDRETPSLRRRGNRPLSVSLRCPRRDSRSRELLLWPISHCAHAGARSTRRRRRDRFPLFGPFAFPQIRARRPSLLRLGAQLQCSCPGPSLQRERLA